MAYTKISTLTDHAVSVFNPSAGSAGGARTYLVAPFRGTVKEIGVIFGTTVTSDTTVAGAVTRWTDSTTSVNTEFITSTLGSFNSVMLLAGNVASVVPPSPVYVDAGDIIRITTSGADGTASTKGGTVYTLFRKG